MLLAFLGRSLQQLTAASVVGGTHCKVMSDESLFAQVSVPICIVVYTSKSCGADGGREGRGLDGGGGRR